jgi:hypothetical protein
MLLDAGLFHDLVRRVATLDAGRHREIPLGDWAKPYRMASSPDILAIVPLKQFVDLSVERRRHLR